MTRYRFDNQIKKTNKSWTTIAAIVFVVAGIFFLVFFVLAPIIRSIARGPQWLHTAATQSLATSASMITPKRDLVAQIVKLESQIAAFDAQSIELRMLRDENAALRQELSYEKNPAQIMLAGVIAKPSQSLYNSIIIDRGSNDGVTVGQLVTTQGTIGLGRIASVMNKTATVALFSGPQFDGNLVIRGQNITVPSIGKGGGNFEIHIPREIVVTDGDILAFPEHPDMAVGVVKSIQFDDRDPFQTVLARVPVNVQELRFVEVVK